MAKTKKVTRVKSKSRIVHLTIEEQPKIEAKTPLEAIKNSSKLGAALNPLGKHTQCMTCKVLKSMFKTAD